MPKRTDLKKILVIGSGPIVIGQAAEFDYAGAQACRVLKEAGVDTGNLAQKDAELTAKIKELEHQLAQVERELKQKDNDTYRRQHATVRQLS